MEAVPKVHRHRQRRHERNSGGGGNGGGSSGGNNDNGNSSAGAGGSTGGPNEQTGGMETVMDGRCNGIGQAMAAAVASLSSSSSSSVAMDIGGVEGGRRPTSAAAVPQRNEQCIVMDVESVAEVAEPADVNATTTTTTTATLPCSPMPQQTVVLVNGHSPDEDVARFGVDDEADGVSSTMGTLEATTAAMAATAANRRGSESPQPTVDGSSRNSSGDAMSLRETLQQLQPAASSAGSHHHHHHHHHHQYRRRTSQSPQSPVRRGRDPDADPATSYFHRGVSGFMAGSSSSGGGGGGELKLNATAVISPTLSMRSGAGVTKKLQSLSDPQASPAQRSTRSRSSLEKSPRRKRSKSESRRRRERKLIAAGELEVRQANETLMRYLKQCSEVNDASLSGELEIDHNVEERRVHRKTKSQRDKRGHIISKLYSAGGLSSILKELSDDIVPADGDEIYNPFTPVVSPTSEAPAHADQMFVQTSSGYRPMDRYYYKHAFAGSGRGPAAAQVGAHESHGCGGGGQTTAIAGSSDSTANLMRWSGGGGSGRGRSRGGAGSGSYNDARCLLDAQCRSGAIFSNLHVACFVQRLWILLSNICHGLLAGMALAHLMFIATSHPMGWPAITNGDATVAQQHGTHSSATRTAADASALLAAPPHSVMLTDYATLAEFYTNTFYCLAIVCLVSVFDRMDIGHLDLSNASELISFRWMVIAMIYLATIILSICSNTIDEKLYFTMTANVTITHEAMLSNQLVNIWSSLSVARSFGAIFGWLLIGLTPHDDLLYEHLLDLAPYQLVNN